jgi:hypothetical protein
MDLVVASYSIYFFPDLLSEVSRVLRAEGLFLAITHSEKTPRSLCEAAGLDQAASPLVAYVRKFSAENGRTLLSRFFGQVESTNYLNDLCFEPRHVEELCEYMRFKLPLLVADNPRPAELSPEIRTRLAEGVRADGRLLINKDDAVFRCREPLVR